MDGRSAWKLAKGDDADWRDALLYEYYWEWNYPQTPTVFAARGEQFKFIRYHGVWDTDELYDLKNDPDETTNLIRDPNHAETAKKMKEQLFALLKESGGLSVPLQPDRGRQFYYRHPDRAKQGAFPKWYYDKPAPVTE